jgi:hypothetical protein
VCGRGCAEALLCEDGECVSICALAPENCGAGGEGGSGGNSTGGTGAAAGSDSVSGGTGGSAGAAGSPAGGESSGGVAGSGAGGTNAGSSGEGGNAGESAGTAGSSAGGTNAGSSGEGGNAGESAGNECETEASEGCGLCGTRTRECQNGYWSEWSECAGQGECAANSSEACGGEILRYCTAACRWCACDETNQVPVSSGAQTANGEVTSSGAYATAFEAWQAFDAIDSMWISAQGQTPAWIAYAWSDAPRFITRYAIRFTNGTLTSRAPRNWTVEGRSGDGEWAMLDTRVDEIDWGGTERREFEIPTPAAYDEYRLTIADDNDSRTGIEVVSISRLEFIGAACP